MFVGLMAGSFGTLRRSVPQMALLIRIDPELVVRVIRRTPQDYATAW